jgi:hypothetical protein
MTGVKKGTDAAHYIAASVRWVHRSRAMLACQSSGQRALAKIASAQKNFPQINLPLWVRAK